MHRAGWERPALGETGLVTLHGTEPQRFQQIALFQRGVGGHAASARRAGKAVEPWLVSPSDYRTSAGQIRQQPVHPTGFRLWH